MLSALNEFGSFRQLLTAVLLCISLVLLRSVNVEGTIAVPFVGLYVVTLVCAMSIVGCGIVRVIMNEPVTLGDEASPVEDEDRARRAENAEMQEYVVELVIDRT